MFVVKGLARIMLDMLRGFMNNKYTKRYYRSGYSRPYTYEYIEEDGHGGEWITYGTGRSWREAKRNLNINLKNLPIAKENYKNGNYRTNM